MPPWTWRPSAVWRPGAGRFHRGNKRKRPEKARGFGLFGLGRLEVWVCLFGGGVLWACSLLKNVVFVNCLLEEVRLLQVALALSFDCF